MRVDTLTLRPGHPLPADVRQAWEALREAGTASPYLSPGFAEAVAEVGAPVRLLVGGRDTPSALLALQGGRVARPVGAPLSDYHGIVGTADASELLEAAGVEVLGVHGWTGSDAALEAVPVCRIDLSDGVEAWKASRDGSYRRHAKSHRRRVRKATEEIGEPRMEWRSRNVDVFNQLLAWKRSQYAATGKYDVLANWPQRLLRNLWERGAESYGGVGAEMQALYFGDRLAAIDLGLVEGTTFHSWIVAYDPDLASYGPGIQLLEATLEAAPELGYATLDLGTGLDGYKRHYGNVEASVGVGTLRTSGARAAVSRAYGKLEPRAEPLARLRRRWNQIAACEPSGVRRMGAVAHAVGWHLKPGQASPAS